MISIILFLIFCMNGFVGSNEEIIVGSALTDEEYFLKNFEKYERTAPGEPGTKHWDKLYKDIGEKSLKQAKELHLSSTLSASFHSKNRYWSILPYDQNRVVLKRGGNVTPDSIVSYINASPLRVPFVAPPHNNFILTQGPLEGTSNDFWQMIFEQNVSICVMLTNVKEKAEEKCYPYYPTKQHKVLIFANYKCELEKEKVKSNYIVRHIRLTPLWAPTRYRIVHHFQYTTWPDHGVPVHTDHFLRFLGVIRRAREKLAGNDQKNVGKFYPQNDADKPPIVVHCSAGIGRTGTFLVADLILSMFLEKKRHHAVIKNGGHAHQNGIRQLNSLEALVVFTRQYRMYLIHSAKQLRFCWKTIVEWIKLERSHRRKMMYHIRNFGF